MSEQLRAPCTNFRPPASSSAAPFGWKEGQAQINRQIAGRLRLAGIPVVLLDCDIVPFPKRSDFDLVGIDNFDAAYMLTEHLLNMGCRYFIFSRRAFSLSPLQ